MRLDHVGCHLVSAGIAYAMAALCSLEHLSSWSNQALTAPW